ncbi:MAG: DUF885 domain-containing protein [Myxococcota bacterium]
MKRALVVFFGVMGCTAAPNSTASLPSPTEAATARPGPNTASATTPEPDTESAPPLLDTLAGGAAALRDCDTDLIYLNHVIGWQVRWPQQWSSLASRGPLTEAEWAQWRSTPQVLAKTVETLAKRQGRSGAAPRPVVLRVSQQLSDLVDALNAEDARYFTANMDPSFKALLTRSVIPAVTEFQDFLRDRYLPLSSTSPGLGALPGGAKCFENTVRWWTSLDLAPNEVSTLGERLLEETRRDLLDTAPANTSFDALLNELRAPVPGTNADRLIAISEAALTRAKERARTAFHALPDSAFEVVPMEKHLRASFPAGYYRGGAHPAYVLNVSRPEERRRMAEVVAFHEGIPGHHLFAVYPRDGESGPFNAGLLEGWAIYAEYLADELGMYASVADRQGMMAKHLWAASRLMIEPGIHVHGWSRARAIEYMYSVTALSRSEIELEIDRYIAMPGQSLAYMLGYDSIRAARERAEKALGPRFDLAGFHHAVVAPGSRSLAAMHEDVNVWMARLTK